MRRIERIAEALLNYCQSKNWAGHDPYDALNSRILVHTPFYSSRIFRIGVTQIIKRLPLNIRPLLVIPQTQNPKALGLFLSAILKLSKIGLINGNDLVGRMLEELLNLKSRHDTYWCWGYSFPWQTRTDLVPRGAPNLVCTTFVAGSLLDIYESNRDTQLLGIAASAADYLLDELYWEDGDSLAGFSYPFPQVQARVHNANLLGAALCCRIYRHSGDRKYLDAAMKVARYSAGQQNIDGSWYYGERPTQRWIDNFHTGYNLCALKSICESTKTDEFEMHLQKGIDFYMGHFFMEDGAPKYFHNRLYPIDIHSAAQSIITLVEFRDHDNNSMSLANGVFAWTMKHLWDEKGYFYYQSHPLYTNKISYMRWSQAWMLLALSRLLENHNPGLQPEQNNLHNVRTEMVT